MLGLGIPITQAEDIKKRYGTVCQDKIISLQNKFEEINLGFDGGVKPVELSAVGEILRFRAEEILDLLITDLIEYRVKNLMPAGLILTGGGGLLDGFKELASEKLSMATRVGVPQFRAEQIPDILKSPAYSTGFGLLLHAMGMAGDTEFVSGDRSTVGRIFKTMKSWIYDFF